LFFKFDAILFSLPGSQLISPSVLRICWLLKERDERGEAAEAKKKQEEKEQRQEERTFTCGRESS